MSPTFFLSVSNDLVFSFRFSDVKNRTVVGKKSGWLAHNFPKQE